MAGAVRRPTARRANPAARVHVFADTEPFGRRLARAAGMGIARVDVHRFPDGESLVRVREPAGRHAVLVRSLDVPNEKLVEILLAADALRRSGARRLTLIAPYLAYMRQDAIFRSGQPLSQRVVAECLGRAVDRVVTVEAHLHRVERLDQVFPCAADSLSAAPAMARWLRRDRERCIVVGPDSESEPCVRAIAQAAGEPWTVGRKARYGDHHVRIRFPQLPARTRAVIVDDIASTGTTLAVAARALRERGIRHVEAIVVHPIFAPGALARIRAAGVRRVVSCDTIPHPTNAIETATLLAEAIR